MTLNFMTKFPDGTLTFFKEKINLGISNMTIPPKGSFCIESYPKDLLPKIHTFRKGIRWGKGIPIHFKQWSGMPYISKTISFAPIIPCTGQQQILIQSPSISLKSRIFIDGKQLDDEKINQLAINDGFNDEKHLFSYFKEHFTGQIVHWTNMRY